MKFKGNLALLQFDLAGYKARLHKHLQEEVTYAAVMWLETALRAVPVWSGASRATFLKLASALGTPISIVPSATSSKSRISEGQSHSTGGLTTDAKKGRYVFEYSTDLKWLISNEFNYNTPENDPTLFKGLLRPGPYHFQDKSKRVFEQIAEQVRLPSPWKSLKSKKIKVG